MRQLEEVKQLVALAAVVLPLLALVGCSRSSTGNPKPTPTRTTSVPATSAPRPSSSADPAPTRTSPASKASSRAAVPTNAKPAHIVIVVMENHSYADIIGNTDARYINSLANSGALFTQSFAVTHPSQPNYLALFSGSTQGISDDSCPNTIDAPNLASQLSGAGLTFAAYSDGLPGVGFTGCSSGSYARKHAPWVNFSSLPASVNQPFTAFPTSFTSLPSVSFVVPNLDNDMHDGSIAQGDQWLQQNLGGYAAWAANNNSLLIVTWDEDDHSQNNQIATIINGAHVRPGRYGELVNHYRLLRTIEAREGLPGLGAAASTQPIADIWAE